MININLRGTHGSGKTTVSQRLIAEHPHEELFGPSLHGKNFKKPIAFALEGGVFCVGRKKSGLDGIYPQEIIEDLIRHYAPLGHVVWENVLIAGNLGRWWRLAQELEPVSHGVWACLDTPVETCIERVYARRAVAKAEGWKHRGEGINEEVLRTAWRRIRRVATNAAEVGADVRWLDHEVAYELVHDTLVRAGWNCPHGLLLPNRELERWTPTMEELASVRATLCLPWEAQIVHVQHGDPASDTIQGDAAVSSPDTELDPLSDPFVDLGDLFGD